MSHLAFFAIFFYITILLQFSILIIELLNNHLTWLTPNRTPWIEYRFLFFLIENREFQLLQNSSKNYEISIEKKSKLLKWTISKNGVQCDFSCTAMMIIFDIVGVKGNLTNSCNNTLFVIDCEHCIVGILISMLWQFVRLFRFNTDLLAILQHIDDWMKTFDKMCASLCA